MSGNLNAIKVQYTVKEEYVEENKKRIDAVMKELRGIENPNIKYQAFLLDDGKSFMHLVFYDGEEAKNLPGDLESFKNFQAGLKENLEVPPKAESFNFVDSSYGIF